MIFGTFSLDPKNMRWFNLRRIVVSLLLFPLFILTFINNTIFLLLDHVFFPGFKKQNIKDPVFIIAAPRSATTFLYHSLAYQKDKFTAMRFWEIIFAPSILQKYIILFLFRIDKKIGSPLKKFILWAEEFLFGKIKKIHLIGLNMPEEDEAILLWNLSTLYLWYFYPDSDYFKAFYTFDESMEADQRKKIMRTYFRYLQRHNYVFNRDNSKRFVSKNPIMMPKIASLYSICPDAKIININRCPSVTIPSTLQLNNTLFSVFTSRPPNARVDNESIELLVKWYQLAHKNLDKYFPESHLKLSFNPLVQKEPSEIAKIAAFLEIPIEDFKFADSNKKVSHKSANQYIPLQGEAFEMIMEKIPFMREYQNKDTH